MRQTDLFESSGAQPQVSTVPDVQAIRERLNRMLDEARRASKMPWDARTARSYERAFPQFANWLPAEEADALCAAFREELEQLRTAEAS